MIAILNTEMTSLTTAYPGSRIADGSGARLVEVPDLPLPPGWSLPATTVWFAIPSGYPAAQPDCFWADPALRLTTGALPQNSGLQTVPATGQPGLWFSWHVSSWRPGRDGVISYVRFITRRLADVR